MSYRPESQSIEDPARALVKDIDAFCDAVDARVEDGKWREGHIDKLILIAGELTALKYKLLRLAKETW